MTALEYSHPLQNENLVFHCLTAHLRSGKDIRFPSLILQVGTLVRAQK